MIMHRMHSPAKLSRSHNRQVWLCHFEAPFDTNTENMTTIREMCERNFALGKFSEAAQCSRLVPSYLVQQITSGWIRFDSGCLFCSPTPSISQRKKRGRVLLRLLLECKSDGVGTMCSVVGVEKEHSVLNTCGAGAEHTKWLKFAI